MCVNVREWEPQLVVLIRCSVSLFSPHASVGGEAREQNGERRTSSSTAEKDT